MLKFTFHAYAVQVFEALNMKKNLTNTPINSNQSIKENKKRIVVLEARKASLHEEIEKLEKKTNKNLIEKTKIEHLKHELKSKSDQIDNHRRFIDRSKEQLEDLV
jgi:uncharacterized protein (DUF2344 family)